VTAKIRLGVIGIMFACQPRRGVEISAESSESLHKATGADSATPIPAGGETNEVCKKCEKDTH